MITFTSIITESIDQPKVLWHGTKTEFDKPKRNSFGMIWLAFDKEMSLAFTDPASPILWKIILKPGAKIIDLRKADNPLTIEFAKHNAQESWDHVAGYTVPITQEFVDKYISEWKGDFSYLERQYPKWIINFMKSHKIDGVIVWDHNAGAGGKGSYMEVPTVALYNLKSIESMSLDQSEEIGV